MITSRNLGVALSVIALTGCGGLSGGCGEVEIEEELESRSGYNDDTMVLEATNLSDEAMLVKLTVERGGDVSEKEKRLEPKNSTKWFIGEYEEVDNFYFECR